MMPKIIDHRHAAGDAANFHSPPDSFEGIERRLDLAVLEPAMLCARNDRERIPHIQFTDQIEVKLRAWNFKLRCSRSKPHIEGPHGILFTEAEAFHRAMRYVEQR